MLDPLPTLPNGWGDFTPHERYLWREKHRPNIHGYAGVTKSNTGKFKANIHHPCTGATVYLGMFDTAKEAGVMYLKAFILIYGTAKEWRARRAPKHQIPKNEDWGWIPVSLKYPEIDEVVLSWDGQEMHVSRMWKDGMWIEISELEHVTATHWAPLPLPPKSPQSHAEPPTKTEEKTDETEH